METLHSLSNSLRFIKDEETRTTAQPSPLIDFDTLPQNVRNKIYRYCAPTRRIFYAAKSALESSIAKHELLGFICTFPQLKHEVNRIVYGRSEFNFNCYDGHKTSFDSVAGFFRKIGPVNTSFVRKFRCCVDQPVLGKFIDMLRVYLSGPPVRYVEDLDLFFFRRRIQDPHVYLRGIVGLESTICFPHYIPDVYLDRLNKDLRRYRRQSFQRDSFFLGLPTEVRLMIYHYLSLFCVLRLSPPLTTLRRSYGTVLAFLFAASTYRVQEPQKGSQTGKNSITSQVHSNACGQAAIALIRLGRLGVFNKHQPVDVFVQYSALAETEAVMPGH